MKVIDKITIVDKYALFEKEYKGDKRNMFSSICIYDPKYVEFLDFVVVDLSPQNFYNHMSKAIEYKATNVIKYLLNYSIATNKKFIIGSDIIKMAVAHGLIDSIEDIRNYKNKIKIK